MPDCFGTSGYLREYFWDGSFVVFVEYVHRVGWDTGDIRDIGGLFVTLCAAGSKEVGSLARMSLYQPTREPLGFCSGFRESREQRVALDLASSQEVVMVELTAPAASRRDSACTQCDEEPPNVPTVPCPEPNMQNYST